MNKYHRDFRIDLILDWIQSYFECCGTTVPGDTALGHNPWNIWHRHPDYECDQRLRTRKGISNDTPTLHFPFCDQPKLGHQPLTLTVGAERTQIGLGATPFRKDLVALSFRRTILL